MSDTPAPKRLSKARRGWFWGGTMPDGMPVDLRERLLGLETYRGRAMAVALKNSRTREDAEDAVQESILKTALIPDLDWERAGALLCSQVKWTCIDTIRSNQRRERRDAAYFLADAWTPDQDDEICDRMAARWLATNFDRLSPVEQTVLRMSMDGAELLQMAEATGLTYKGAHSALTRARRRMNGYWRAALGGLALGALTLKSRRAGVVTASVVGVGVGVALLPGVSEPPPPRGPSVATIIDDAGVEGVPVPTARSFTPAATTAHVASSTSETSRFVRVVRDIPGKNQLLDPVDVGIEQPHETLVETLVSCVSEGINIGLEDTSCGAQRAPRPSELPSAD